MTGFVDYIIPNSDPSWLELFGRYEDNPKDFIEAVAKFSEIIDEAEQKEIENSEVIEVNGEEDVT